MTLLFSDDRSYLTAEHASRYCFGDAAAPLLLLNAVDSFGCAWVADEPTGWDAAPVSTPIDRRQDGYGGILGESFIEERVLAWDGAVVAPSPQALRAARQRWLQAQTGSLAGYVLYTHLDEEDGPWGLWLRPTGNPKFQAKDDRVAVFSMSMVADDPLKFGSAVTYGPARLPSGSGDPGRSYPRSYPYSYGGAGQARPGVLSIANTPAAVGGDYAQAVYTITGPVPQARIVLSTGVWLGLSVDLGALDVLVVDTAAGTVQINGANRPDALAAGSSFPLIPPGGVEVRLRSATGGSDQTAGLTVTTAPRRK